jgi:signal transduction histidine kinase
MKMKDADKTKEQLIHELAELRLKITKFGELETGLKKTKEKLEHQKKHLESLIKYSSLAIVTLDEGKIIISCNRDFEKLLKNSFNLKNLRLLATISMNSSPGNTTEKMLFLIQKKPLKEKQSMDTVNEKEKMAQIYTLKSLVYQSS